MLEDVGDILLSYPIYEDTVAIMKNTESNKNKFKLHPKYYRYETDVANSENLRVFFDIKGEVTEIPTSVKAEWSTRHEPSPDNSASKKYGIYVYSKDHPMFSCMNLGYHRMEKESYTFIVYLRDNTSIFDSLTAILSSTYCSRPMGKGSTSWIVKDCNNKKELLQVFTTLDNYYKTGLSQERMKKIIDGLPSARSSYGKEFTLSTPEEAKKQFYDKKARSLAK